MKTLFVYLTYNRPKVLEQCLATSLGNTSVPIDEAWIVDDGSERAIQANITNFALQNRDRLPINLVLNQKNYGIGWNFEMAYNIMRIKDPEYICFLEADYIFRKGWLEDCMAVFDAAPYTVAILGTSHPDCYDRQKTHGLFPKLMMEQFPKDVAGREYMYQPFGLETSRGKISVQGASNSCGCSIFAWQRFKKILQELDSLKGEEVGYYEREYWRWMDRAFNKQAGGDRRYASDQHFSGTVTGLWYEWAEALKQDFDLSKNFPWLDICDYSIADHKCALGINGMVPGMKEGDTFVGSPVWNEKYLTEDPRMC